MMTRHAIGKWAALAVGALFLLGAFWARGTAQPRRGADGRTVRGTVRSFTSAPKGEIDGLMLADGTWVHWPPHLEARFKAIVARGDRIEATGRWETGKKGETKFEVRRVTNLRTGAARTNPDMPAPPAEVEREPASRGSTEARL